MTTFNADDKPLQVTITKLKKLVKLGKTKKVTCRIVFLGNVSKNLQATKKVCLLFDNFRARIFWIKINFISYSEILNKVTILWKKMFDFANILLVNTYFRDINPSHTSLFAKAVF